MSYYQAIETKFLGPTNHRGSRVKAFCQAGSLTIEWDHSLNSDNNHLTAAENLAARLEWHGKWFGGSNAKGNGHVFVWAGKNPEPAFVLEPQEQVA